MEDVRDESKFGFLPLTLGPCAHLRLGNNYQVVLKISVEFYTFVYISGVDRGAIWGV